MARVRLADRRATRWALLAATAILGGIFVGVIGEPPPQTFLRRNMELLRGKSFEQGDYPEPMVRFIIDTRLPDRMFSEINYCGYLMWRLSPERHKLFTDNRFDLFGSRFYPYEYTVAHGMDGGNEFANGMRVEKGWEGILDEWGVNFVVIARDMDAQPPPARERKVEDHLLLHRPRRGGRQRLQHLAARRAALRRCARARAHKLCAPEPPVALARGIRPRQPHAMTMVRG